MRAQIESGRSLQGGCVPEKGKRVAGKVREASSVGLIWEMLRKEKKPDETKTRHRPGLWGDKTASRLSHIPLRAWQWCYHMQTEHQYVWYVGEPALLCR